MSRQAPLLVMSGIGKQFPGTRALRGAHLELWPGEAHVLVGENGAGKSTLMKVLCGQYHADEGTITLDGHPIAPASPRQAERLGLVMIHQELNLVPQLSVAANLCLGHEPGRWGLLDRQAMRRQALRLLRRLGCELDPDQTVAGLSVAHQQIVEIAKALWHEARVLVMDEPTAALARHEIEALFNVIRSLCAQGVAVVYISHRLDEVFAIGHRITVMRDGHNIATRTVDQVTPDQLVSLMVGRTIAEQIPKVTLPLGPVALEVREIRRVPFLGPMSFSVRQGEVLGVAGLMGSGRTALARAIFGADPLVQGQVLVDGQPVQERGPRGAAAAGIGLVTEDRKGQGLVLPRSVIENLTLASLDDVQSGGLLNPGRERQRARHFVDRLRIRLASLDQPVATLSGGNQQKVVLAKWLAARCRVILFDEPTRGIDVGAKAEIYACIGDLVRQGVAVVLISSDIPELLGLADRVAVLFEGQLQGILGRAAATPETVLQLALGPAQPSRVGCSVTGPA